MKKQQTKNFDNIKQAKKKPDPNQWTSYHDTKNDAYQDTKSGEQIRT